MKKFNFCLVIGLLLCAAALCLSAYNICRDLRAGKTSDAALTALAPIVSDNAAAVPPQGADVPADERFVPDYILDEAREMPVRQIDGREYIGVLDIPALSLTLPVLKEWDYPGLNVAPCRYAGSAYTDGFVIAAHNYDSHFGRIGSLSPGDSVRFTDIDGNVFDYSVAAVETLDPYAAEDMKSDAWSLSLFTCTLGGQYRVTVRCDRTE